MCGICGIVFSDRNWRVKADLLAGMNRQIVHRGPDDDGFFVEENVGLAMRRLSIIDVLSGHQPLANENQDVWMSSTAKSTTIVELRGRLRPAATAIAPGDTETIVHLYEEYGSDCVEHLRGMFAFAIWDRRRRDAFRAATVSASSLLYYRLGWTRVSVRLGDQGHPRLSRSRGRVQPWQRCRNIWPSVTYRGRDDVCGNPEADAGTYPGAEASNGEPSIEQYWDLSTEVDAGAASPATTTLKPTANCWKPRLRAI